MALSQHEAALPLMRKHELMVVLKSLCVVSAPQLVAANANPPSFGSQAHHTAASATASSQSVPAPAAASVPGSAKPSSNQRRPNSSSKSTASLHTSSSSSSAAPTTAAPAAKSSNKKLTKAAVSSSPALSSSRQDALNTVSATITASVGLTLPPNKSSAGAPSRVSNASHAGSVPNPATAPCTPLQLGVLSFCCNLSAHAPLHADMLQAGAWGGQKKFRRVW